MISLTVFLPEMCYIQQSVFVSVQLLTLQYNNDTHLYVWRSLTSCVHVDYHVSGLFETTCGCFGRYFYFIFGCCFDH